MPTDKPRITITMPEDQLDKVQTFQHENKLKNQTQAILHLIELGFEELARQTEFTAENKKTPTPEESDMSVSELSTEEKLRIALKQLGILDDKDNLNDADLAFLQHMFLAIQAHFQKAQENIY